MLLAERPVHGVASHWHVAGGMPPPNRARATGPLHGYERRALND